MFNLCQCVIGFSELCEEHDEANPYVDPFVETELAMLAAAPSVAGTSKERKSLYVDPKSTGRKLAVQLKPIAQGDVCEWSGLLRAGGGVHPIIGCADRLAKNVHHGPDKNTLNNDLSNLHKICANCHNRWHAVNDPTYPADVPGTTWLPEGDWEEHDPDTKATIQQIAANETQWKELKRERLRAERAAARAETEDSDDDSAE